jgi:hypothetical protein
MFVNPGTFRVRPASAELNVRSAEAQGAPEVVWPLVCDSDREYIFRVAPLTNSQPCPQCISAYGPCAADFNHDGVIDTADVYDFLTKWLGGDPLADFKPDTVVDIGDLLSFVKQWFATDGANCS